VYNSFDSDRLRRGDDVAIVRDAFDADGAGGALCIVCPEAESALAIGIHHKVGIPIERDALYVLDLTDADSLKKILQICVGKIENGF